MSYINIVCYKENGKIIDCNTANHIPIGELKDLALKYNKNETNVSKNRRVEIKIVDEDSLEAYLIKNLEAKRKVDKECIQEMQRVLSELDDMIDSLNFYEG